MTETMTRTDRETLIKIARQRERVAKSEAKERAAHLLSDFEAQMDRRYSYDENAVWEKATEAVNAVVADAKKAIAEECRRLGIPAEFAPGITAGWYGRGRNASKSERVEMRRIAQRQIDAAEKSARTAIERRSVEIQEQIMVSGLTSDDARSFLESMPSADTLMPALTVDGIKALIGGEA
ncbi:hypothetical protein [Jiella pelagia]|uniref:Uncharacterized protein n=1 Tax=Jiella pelagia TaxID=2986949 RepID=A0ABY7C1S8_9HYPH|nr:hypothetical protein [Jiella pelagia]WAP69300.1 hypothetical protein OH818_03095 [Jiella pelagia]